uniref:redoxin domain-containing protein n=1 Tax=Ningiella ruwaisensis TaxID=2364274 RepID=UPI0019D5A40B|nr:redoxin domain-containing protein [Ningiella ruwaisensis]
MIKGFMTSLVLLLASMSALASITIGEPAPTFTLQNTKGENVALEDFKGQYVVLEWTNHQCPYVVKHYDSDNMQSLQRKYTEQDVVWLSIISSAPGKQGYVDAQTADSLSESRNAVPSHVLFDPEGSVGKQYDAQTTPHMYIIDPQGMLQYAGGIDSIKSTKQSDIAKATNYVDEAMTALLAGEAVKNTLTPPYGCSIKYKS